MAINKGKHIVNEIDGVRCTIIESGIKEDRVKFLKELLEFNNYEVKVAKEENKGDDVPTFTIGVTDIIFNPVIAIYEGSLKTPTGERVSPAYWNQWTTVCNSQYWKQRKKV
jgi:hypothetical protein